MIRKDCPADGMLNASVPIDSATGNPRNRGFTLIEIMIVVAIIGILAAIAFPSYQWVLQRSYKTEAKTNLTSLTLLLEQHKSVYGCYGKRTGAVCPTTATTYEYKENDAGTATTNTITTWLNFNARLATDVEAGKGIRYDYKISAGDDVTPPTFEVKATPLASRGASDTGDYNGVLKITQAGAKTGWR